MVLTDEQKKLVQSTAPLLKDHGKTIVADFYQKVQESNPDLRNYFNQSSQNTGTQPEALAHTLYCAAQYIEKLDTLMPQVEQIANKHRALLVKPEHYPIVGKFLLQAISDFLGAKATPEVLEAWKAAYSVISSIFIGIEKEMYNKLGDAKNFAEFKIVKKDNVGSGPIVAVTIERADGGSLPDFQAGQYIAVRLEHGGMFHNRFYGLAELSNGKSYTFLVQKESENATNAAVSNEIVNNLNVDSTVLVTPPSGTFGLVSGASNNLFLASGVGIAPVAAMIKSLNAQGKSGSASLLYCANSADQAPFADQLSGILGGNYTFLAGEQPITKDVLASNLKADTQVYVSGNEPFVSAVVDCLVQCNHPKSQIRTESIGPTLCVLKLCC